MGKHGISLLGASVNNISFLLSLLDEFQFLFFLSLRSSFGLSQVQHVDIIPGDCAELIQQWTKLGQLFSEQILSKLKHLRLIGVYYVLHLLV